MSKHSEIRRYFLVIEKIRYGRYPSFKDIKEFLYNHGFQIADRTLQRDIEQIRYDFGVEITYNRAKNGYWIDPEGSINLESFFHFMEIVNTAHLLTESLQESKDALRHISFGTGGGMQGIDNVKPLLSAIRTCKIIQFSHQFCNRKNYPLCCQALFAQRISEQMVCSGYSGKCEGIAFSVLTE